jgi:hypothetical protein
MCDISLEEEMKRSLFLKTTLLALVVLFVAGSAWATMGRSSYFNYPEFRIVSEVERGKTADFELSFSSIIWVDSTERMGEGRLWLTDTTDTSITVTVTVLNDKDTLSSEAIAIELTDDSVQVLRFSAMIPNLDTISVVAVIEQAGITERSGRYFAWNGSEMEPSLGDPRLMHPYLGGGVMMPMPTPTRVYTRPEWAPPERGAEAINARGFKRRDSVRTAWMRELEQTPLTDSAWQRITIGGVKYTRRRGDSLFREGFYYEELHDSVVRAKMAEFEARTEHEICLDLSDTANYRLVTSMLGAGTPSSKPGYYIFTATKDLINELSSRGFGVMYLEQHPSMRPETPDSSAMPDSAQPPNSSGSLDGDNVSGSREVIFFEDFGWVARRLRWVSSTILRSHTIYVNLYPLKTVIPTVARPTPLLRNIH